MLTLISTFIVVIGMVLFSFLVALIFQPFKWAFCSSITFTFGVVIGSALSLSLWFIFFGSEDNVTSTLKVILFLLLLVVGGISGGGLSLWLLIKSKRSNPSFKR